LLLALIDSRDGLTRFLRPVAGAVMTPVQEAVNGATAPIGSFITDWQQLGARKERIAELEAANAELRARLHTASGDDRRRSELDALLEQAGTAQFKLVVARVVAIGSNQGFGNTVLIDAGSLDSASRRMRFNCSVKRCSSKISTSPRCHHSPIAWIRCGTVSTTKRRRPSRASSVCS